MGENDEPDNEPDMAKMIGMLHELVDNMSVLVETAQAHRQRILDAGFDEVTANHAAGEFLIVLQTKALDAVADA